MATTGKQWEVVRTTGKKTKNAPATLTKSQQKNYADKMPRIEAAPPLKESSTMYEGFLEQERRQTAKENGHIQAASESNTKKAATQKKKQTTTKERKKPPVDVQTAVKEIDVSDLESVFTRAQATFPDNPLVWLKDLASVLNLKMDRVPEPDPVFQGKPHDFPVSALPKAVAKLLLSIVNQCSSKTLDLFLEHCVTTMITDSSKGISSYGCRMFIQMLLHNKPAIVMDSLPKYQEMIHSNQNRPLRCLSILWAVGQAGVKNPATGLRVWMDVIYPVLNQRNLATYAVEYLENLFALHKNLRPAHGVLSSKELLALMELMFNPQSGLSPNLQRRLQTLCPKLKELVFASQGGSKLQSLFPMLLTRLTPGCSHGLQRELLECLVECLAVDKLCFSVWRQLYTKTISQSGVLLSHLNNYWDTTKQRLDTKVLRETVRTFDVTNGELVAKGTRVLEGHQMCSTACKDLLAKMSKNWFPWRQLLFLLLVVTGATLAYDIYSSKGFANCRTRAFLADTGILLFLEQVWQRIRIYSAKAIVWMQENIPYYYRRVCEFSGPYLKLFWEKLYDLGVWVAEATKQQRAWLNEKIPLLLEWVNAKLPWLWSNLSYYLGLVWEVLLQYSIWLWDHLVYYGNLTATWLLKNVFTGSLSPENILATVSSLLQALQTYITAAIHWGQKLVSGPESASPSS